MNIESIVDEYNKRKQKDSSYTIKDLVEEIKPKSISGEDFRKEVDTKLLNYCMRKAIEMDKKGLIEEANKYYELAGRLKKNFLK